MPRGIARRLWQTLMLASSSLHLWLTFCRTVRMSGQPMFEFVLKLTLKMQVSTYQQEVVQRHCRIDFTPPVFHRQVYYHFDETAFLLYLSQGY